MCMLPGKLIQRNMLHFPDQIMKIEMIGTSIYVIVSTRATAVMFRSALGHWQLLRRSDTRHSAIVLVQNLSPNLHRLSFLKNIEHSGP